MSGVDRAALIEAAEKASPQVCGCDDCLGGLALDAVLELVAQAIEDAVRQDIYTAGLTAAARLVRSLAEEGQQQ